MWIEKPDLLQQVRARLALLMQDQHLIKFSTIRALFIKLHPNESPAGVEDAIMSCMILKYRDKELMHLWKEYNRGYFENVALTRVQKRALRDTYRIVEKILSNPEIILLPQELKKAS